MRFECYFDRVLPPFNPFPPIQIQHNQKSDKEKNGAQYEVYLTTKATPPGAKKHQGYSYSGKEKVFFGLFCHFQRVQFTA